MIIDDIHWALPELQAQEETLMTGTVTVREPSTEVLDPDTGQYVTTPGALVYTGKANVKTDDVAVRQVVAGGERLAVAPIVVKIPWSVSARILPGYEVLVVESDDPTLVDVTMYVKASGAATLGAICRRITCTENVDA